MKIKFNKFVLIPSFLLLFLFLNVIGVLATPPSNSLPKLRSLTSLVASQQSKKTFKEAYVPEEVIVKYKKGYIDLNVKSDVVNFLFKEYKNLSNDNISFNKFKSQFNWENYNFNNRFRISIDCDRHKTINFLKIDEVQSEYISIIYNCFQDLKKEITELKQILKKLDFKGTLYV